MAGIVIVRAGAVPRAMAVETYVAPFADFLGRFGRDHVVRRPGLRQTGVPGIEPEFFGII